MVAKRIHKYESWVVVEPDRSTEARGARIANPWLHRPSNFKAFCVCAREMLQTTPQDVYNGVQPRCPKCPPVKDI
jgi:hypothetical protein